MPAARPNDDARSRDRGSVLSLTKYIPYPAVTHAGGQYVLAHDRAVGAFADIENLAPDTALNREALPLAAAGGGPPAALLEGARVPEGRIPMLLLRIESVLAGSTIHRPVRRLFAGERAPWQRLASADVVELQWSEMIALAPRIRRRLPRKPLIGIAHDVFTQRWDRQADECGFAPKRWLLRLAAGLSRRRESRSFAALDMLIVFSEKDAQLARRMSPGTRVEVVHPGLGPTDPLPRAPHDDEPIVLFTGAMNRPENQQAVSWFVEEMWPRVLRAVPSARFVIAGANPSPELEARIAAAPRAELTGFVDSLEPCYAEASVFAVPLRTGAGVKFKTIDAMLRGVPIVTTSVGAEGIEAGGVGAPLLFAALTDNAERFADGVIEQLRAPDEARVAEARHWAEGVYGTSAFEARVRELYAEYVGG